MKKNDPNRYNNIQGIKCHGLLDSINTQKMRVNSFRNFVIRKHVIYMFSDCFFDTSKFLGRKV